MKRGKSISHWMTSALTKGASSAPVSSVTKETKSKASTGSRKRKAPNRPPVKKEVHNEVDTSDCAGGDELPWAAKHQPKTAVDLAVHKKKIEEVQQWLEFALSPTAHHPIVLLTGPPGCGKTATLQALSYDLSFSVVEWVNQVNSTKIEVSDDMTLFPESQSRQFLMFLTRANRYPTLHLGGGDSPYTTRKVVLVEEFPNAFLRDPCEFHRLIKSISRSLIYPLVLISSETHHGNSSNKLFPTSLLAELNIHTISFNPVAHTSLVKTLQKISTLECAATGRGVRGAEGGKFHMPPREVIERLADSSAGDVRSAVNALQFTCLRDSTDLLSGGPHPPRTDKRSVKLLRQRSSSSGRLKRHGSTDFSKPFSIGGRDCSLFLFRALGKILYCKRDTEAETTPTLPARLQLCERLPLLVNPEEVLEHCQLSSEMFALYLQQNYLAFFDSMDDATEGIAYLSDADLLSRFWSDSKETRAVLQSYAGSVSCRGLMFSNRSTAGGKWRPLHKPQWNSVKKQYFENCSTARGLFLHLGASPFAHLWTPIELQTEILPFLSLVNPPLRNSDLLCVCCDVMYLVQGKRRSYRLSPTSSQPIKDTTPRHWERGTLKELTMKLPRA
ncbi:cell cycle checkpoint protein RAD17-like isoform X2 [Halichondria panicea]|uniref:cell cycle checkpoint protein RAD17-like isoform X2 n=1 Tax=Halichondria panicea TaxID=6063 RepID=UPI00312B4747